MKLKEAIAFCHEFYKRFSTLSLERFQFKFTESSDSCSISLISRNEEAEITASIYITEDEVRLLKIDSFDPIDSCFVYDTPLELYTNILSLLLVCCHASGVFISPSEAVSVTLSHKIKTWQELVIYICSLLPKEQGIITVQENRQNALKLLKTSFSVNDGVFMIDGLYKSQSKFKDILELIRAVLDALSAVLKIYDYVIDPFEIQDEAMRPGRSQ